jgi:hypothetical protein
MHTRDVSLIQKAPSVNDWNHLAGVQEKIDLGLGRVVKSAFTVNKSSETLYIINGRLPFNKKGFKIDWRGARNGF